MKVLIRNASIALSLVVVIVLTFNHTLAQNVGVDVATPQQKLDVAGGLRISTSGNAIAGSIRFNAGQFEVCAVNGIWTAIGSMGSQGSLDDAYDNGSTITADVGSVAINGTAGIFVSGTYGSGLAVGATGGIPQGAGTRMFFNPSKAAFRAGYVSGTQWNDANIGAYSTAMGYNTTASGFASTAMGYQTIASGFASTTMGFNTTASGTTSTAMGQSTTASEGSSTAMGDGTTASGIISTAMGYNTTASGITSTAMGKSTTASGVESTAMGYQTIASGITSTAMGKSTTASGVESTAMGYQTIASGITSTAMGKFTNASGVESTAMGYQTTASGDRSTAMGSNTTAPSFAETAVGRYNTTYTPASTTAWNAADRLFVVGNGTGTGASSSNALTIYKNGKMNINDAYDMPTADGAANTVMTTNGAGVVSFVDPGTLSPVIFANTSGVTSNENGTYATNDFVFGSPQLADNGNTANDNRFFFDKSKGAFRAGRTLADQWDDANVGNFSVALGAGTIASGNIATALGAGTTASGGSSTAMGEVTIASGLRSTAMGYFTTASGAASTAMGFFTTAPSFGETVIGRYNTDYTPLSTTAWNTADRLFVVGNGISSTARANAIVVLKNGNTGISAGAPTYRLQVNGQPAAAGYTQFTNYSDARLKTNIIDLESSLEKIMALRPISYNYNETYLKLYNDSTSLTKVHKGFIAQEIKEVFPEMVGTVNIEGTEYFDLNLSHLPTYTVKAIQEQQALIQQLLQRIEQLENR
jgi:hypothetical protein